MPKEKFYPVYFPIVKEEVAHIIVKDEKAMLGRHVKCDLSAITKGKLGELGGLVNEIKSGKVYASLTAIRLYSTYIRRFVHRGITKIDDSFSVESTDKKKLQIKIVLMTRKKVKGKVEKALRKEARDFLAKTINAATAEDTFVEILQGELQKKLSKKLKKVYPLSFCEIREVLLKK